MIRSRPLTSIDYSEQLAVNLDELDKRERLNINDVVAHNYLHRIFTQYESFGLQTDTILFCVITALGAISNRSFIRRHDNIPVMLNHGSVIVGKTGTNKTAYIKLIRHAINTLTYHYESIYHPKIDKSSNKIDFDQVPPRPSHESSSTSSKMQKASFMTEVCTELAITKNLATIDTFLCHDEGDILLSMFGFYSPADSKHAGGINLLCSALDGLSNYNRTTGHQNINVKNSNLSLLLATTGSKMSSTLQIMHQKQENVGILGRLNLWHLASYHDFMPPTSNKLVSDIASVDHLLIIAHEVFQHSPEFRFKKHTSDLSNQNEIDRDEDTYMKALRINQGITNENMSNTPVGDVEHQYDISDTFVDSSVDIDSGVSAFKLMLSILNSDFRLAQQMDEHLVGCVRKAPTKFPRICALLCILELIGDIASNLLKYVVFDEGNFSRPQSGSNKFISLDFATATKQYVSNYLRHLPYINDRPIIYIDKSQVERAYVFYTYIETTTKILFDASLVNQASHIVQQTNPTNHLSKTQKQEISWIAKVLKSPVIFFSYTYLGKTIPGCAGSGVLKNAPKELRDQVLDLMKKEGLISSDHFLSGMKMESFLKIPPNILRKNENVAELFTKFGPSFTLNYYEKIYESFGLITAPDTTPIPITSVGVKLLREDNAFVDYYHCLDKDEGVFKMIQERITLKEINLVHYFKNGPRRYELLIKGETIASTFLTNTGDRQSESVNDNTSSTILIRNTNHLQDQPLHDAIDHHEERSNSSSVDTQTDNLYHCSNISNVEQPLQKNNHPQSISHAQQQQQQRPLQLQPRDESLISIDSDMSLSSILSPSVDHQNRLQSTPTASSPISLTLFQSLLNFDENSNMTDTLLDDLSALIEEHNSLSPNTIIENSQIMPQLPFSVVEKPKFISQPFSITNMDGDMAASPIACPEIHSENCSPPHQIENETDKSPSSHSIIVSQIPSDAHDQINPNSSSSSDQQRSKFNTIGHVLLDGSRARSYSVSLPEQTEDLSSNSNERKKRGRKSNINKSPVISIPVDLETILADHNHPIYERLILLGGIVFSKSDITHAAQQYSDLRDHTIGKLCNEGIFIKDHVFAKRNSAGSIEYLEGYIKHCPLIGNDTLLNIEDSINWGNKLAKYSITFERYIQSFNDNQLSIENTERGFIKRILNRSDIKLTSYLFSSKLVDYINKNPFFSERFSIDPTAVCSDQPLLMPITSNTIADEYQQMQLDQLKQHQKAKKRALHEIQDNAGPAPKSSRRRL